MDSVLSVLGTPGWELAIFGLQGGQPAAMVPLMDKRIRKVVGFIVMVDDPGQFRFRVFDARKPERYGFDNARRQPNARNVFIVTDLFNQRAYQDKPSVMGDPCMMYRKELQLGEQARRTGGNGQVMVKAMPYAISMSCYTTVACTGDGRGTVSGMWSVQRSVYSVLFGSTAHQRMVVQAIAVRVIWLEVVDRGRRW